MRRLLIVLVTNPPHWANKSFLIHLRIWKSNQGKSNLTDDQSKNGEEFAYRVVGLLYFYLINGKLGGDPAPAVLPPPSYKRDKKAQTRKILVGDEIIHATHLYWAKKTRTQRRTRARGRMRMREGLERYIHRQTRRRGSPYRTARLYFPPLIPLGVLHTHTLGPPPLASPHEWERENKKAQTGKIDISSWKVRFGSSEKFWKRVGVRQEKKRKRLKTSSPSCGYVVYATHARNLICTEWVGSLEIPLGYLFKKQLKIFFFF